MLELGFDPAILAPAEHAALAQSRVLRPFVRLDLCASIVPGSAWDEERWYSYSAGITSGETGEKGVAVLKRIANGAVQTLEGVGGILQISASDGFQGQQATAQFPLSGLPELMARVVRPQDRLRLSIVVPGSPDPEWVVFDGLVQGVRFSTRAGAGFSASWSLSAAGIQSILASAIYNWQGFVHPDSSVIKTGVGKTLFERLGRSAHAPHFIAQAFIESALNSTMGIRIGDARTVTGLKIMDYVRFADGDWSSWEDVAFPLPYSLIQSQSGGSFWQILQAVAEPMLHELFVGYRAPAGGGAAVPALIHRPRPLPGLPKWDNFWKALSVVKVGGQSMPSLMGADDVLSAQPHPNCFHWAGMGLGDHSREAFQARIAFGWATSDQMVNRYGYSSVPVVSKLGPVAPGSDASDFITFAKDHLQHFAAQEIAQPLLRSRSLEGVFLPVRPGTVLEDHTLGSTTDKVVTGYVTATTFSLRATGDSISFSTGVTVERALRGTDAAGYPDAIRALVPDLTLKAYAGRNLGDPGPFPAVDATYTPPPAEAPPPPQALPANVYAAIKAAAARQSIPAWFIAHILHNETGFGRFWGNTPSDITAAKVKGIGQITNPAVADLVADGYKNPDGTTFAASDRGDITKNVHAAARFLKLAQAGIEQMPGGFPASGVSYYSWVARAYRWGVSSTRTFASGTNWAWPTDGEPYPDYSRYWSPEGIKRGMSIWGWLG